MSYTLIYAVTLGPSRAGLALKYQLIDSTNSLVGSAVTAGYEEVAGVYMVPVTIPDGHQGGVRVLNAADNSILVFGDINPSLGENADVKTSTRSSGAAGDPWLTPLPGAYTGSQAGYLVGHNLDAPVSSRTAGGVGPITLVSPVSENGDIGVIVGDDYGPTPPNLQRILLTLGAGRVPDLTGGTVQWVIPGLPGSPLAGVIVTASASGPQQVAIDGNMATWPPGRHPYACRCTTAAGLGSKTETVMRGVLTVSTAP